MDDIFDIHPSCVGERPAPRGAGPIERYSRIRLVRLSGWTEELSQAVAGQHDHDRAIHLAGAPDGTIKRLDSKA